MGVRDALRMVDSFNKWAQRNKDRAKDLDDFIHDGLIAAAKRCESCLKDDLGLTFVEGEDHPLAEQIPSGYEATLPEEEASSTLTESAEEVTLPPTEEDFSIETVGKSDSDEIEDISLEGPTREFTSDFELVEPSPIIIEPESSEEVIVPTEDPDATKASFTWADYEEAVSPPKEEPEVAEDSDEMTSEDPVVVADESRPIDEPVSFESSRVLTPSDEPALPTDEFESPIEQDLPPPVDMEDIEEIESPEPITEPPPPPPPPESEEDEDERRRRARRLFFGD